MEKAHPGVQDIFFQVFDKGNMKDGEGRDIDFKNTVHHHDIERRHGSDRPAVRGSGDDARCAGLADALMPELMKSFKPAFLGRVTFGPVFSALAGNHSPDRRASTREN